jgi:hypothetical protein
MLPSARSVLTLTLLASTLALTACTTTLEKPGMTAQEWERDKYECTLVGRQAAAGASAGGIIAQEFEAANTRNQCMVMRGYTKAR